MSHEFRLNWIALGKSSLTWCNENKPNCEIQTENTEHYLFRMAQTLRGLNIIAQMNSLKKKD